MRKMESYGEIFSISNKSCEAFVHSFKNSRVFGKSFVQKYSYIKVYHATRLSGEEIKLIRKDGIKTSSASMLERKAIVRFINSTDTIELQEGIRSEIITYLNSDNYTDGGKIFFNLLKKDFEKKAAHYLLFGGETLIGMAHHLSEKFPIKFTDRLSQFGQPYIIHSLVKSSSIEKRFIWGIFNYIHGNHPESCITSYQDLNPIDILRFQHIAKPDDEYFRHL